MSLLTKIQQLAHQYFESTIQFRRHLHQYPELSFQEFKTTAFIEQQLTELDIEIQKFAETGLVALLNGNNASKKCIAIRADIDALPILEQNNINYRSKHEGIMHACGHDVHSACLFGAIQILNALKNEFEGCIKFIFQAGEEKLPGGASILIEHGVLDSPTVDAIFGLHVFPELEAGKVGFREGLYMASADELHIEIIGQGGHAALAKNLKDPIVVMSHLLIEVRKALETIQETDIPYVIGFGDVQAHGATNVIPNVVHIQGTFRTMSEEWRKKAHETMISVAQKLAQLFDVQINFNIHKGYPFLNNHVELTRHAKQTAVELLGQNQVIDLPIRMTSEDFSYYTHHTKGCFFRLGTSSKTDFKSSVHTPTFNVDEQAIYTGMSLMAALAIHELNHNSK